MKKSILTASVKRKELGFYSVQEQAVVLCLNPNTLYKLAAAGRYPKQQRIIGNRVGLPVEVFHGWLDEQQTKQSDR